MSGKSGDRGDVRFTEEQFRTIVARAQDLDQRWAAGLSETEVREIAGELGISARAISRALEESRDRGAIEPFEAADPAAEPAPVKLDARAGLRALGRNAAPNALIGVLLGLGAGVAVAAGLPGTIAAGLLVAAYTAAAASALIAGGERRRTDFQLANAGLWCGFGAGIFLSFKQGPSWDELILMTWVWGTTSAVGGELLMRLRDWWRKRPPILAPITSFVRRALARPRIAKEMVERERVVHVCVRVDAATAIPATSA